MRDRLPLASDLAESSTTTPPVSSSDADIVEVDRREEPTLPLGSLQSLARVRLDHYLHRAPRNREVVKGRRHLRGRLFRRNLLSLDTALPDEVALRHTHRCVNHRRCVYLHPHSMGTGRVHLVQIQNLLEVVEHPLDAPAPRVKLHRLFRPEALRVQDIR